MMHDALELDATDKKLLRDMDTVEVPYAPQSPDELARCERLAALGYAQHAGTRHRHHADHLFAITTKGRDLVR